MRRPVGRSAGQLGRRRRSAPTTTAHAGSAGRVVGHARPGTTASRVSVRDPVLGDVRRGSSGAGERQLGRRDHERAAGQQRHASSPERERRSWARRTAAPGSVAVTPSTLGLRGDRSAHAAVGDDDALRPAGRARGVDDVGRVVRAAAARVAPVGVTGSTARPGRPAVAGRPVGSTGTVRTVPAAQSAGCAGRSRSAGRGVGEHVRAAGRPGSRGRAAGSAAPALSTADSGDDQLDASAAAATATSPRARTPRRDQRGRQPVGARVQLARRSAACPRQPRATASGSRRAWRREHARDR